jgi:acetyl esterase/lipase
MKNLLTCLFLALALCGFSQTDAKSWKDVNYAGDTLKAHLLDIYLPSAPKEKYPVVVILYGSAWMSNSSKGADLNSLGKALLDAGFAIVMPNHRNSFEAKFPAQMHDIKAVIRYVRANASAYQFDTTFVGITGSSSGGNMAAMAGTTRFLKTHKLGASEIDLEGTVGKHVTSSSSVDAVVDWFGPTNMLVMDSCGGTDFIHNDAKSPASLYIGGPIQENKDRTLQSCPTTYVDAGDPPFLIFHGDKDRVVPHCQSKILFDALQKAKVPSQFFLVPDGQHGPGVHTAENMNKMVEFFLAEAAKKK